MDTRLDLYNIPQLKEEDNLIIDNLGGWTESGEEEGSFLDSIDDIQHYVIESFQVQKFHKDLSIIVPLGLTTSDIYPIAAYKSRWTYARFTIKASPLSYFCYYYFIDRIEYVAEQSFRLILKIDALNTFKNLWHYGDKTIYQREHQDRYKKGVGNNISPIFSKTSENIQVNTYSYNQQDIEDTAQALQHKFYLVYRKVNESPVVQLYADEDLPLSIQSGTSVSSTYTPNNLIEGQYYYALTSTPQAFTPTFNALYGAAGGSNGNFRILIFIKKGNAIRFSFLQDESRLNYNVISSAGFADELIINNYSGIYRGSYFTSNTDTIKGFTKIANGIEEYNYIPNINNLDRTLKDIYKVVECPYCPIAITYASGLYALPSGWGLVNGIPTAANLTPTLERAIYNFDINSHLNIAKNTSQLDNTLLYDPKCYTSSFIKSYFYYDSFNMFIPLEALNFNTLNSQNIKIIYKQSNNISSSLLFKFSYEGMTLNEQNDFSNYIMSNRNNELPIYNDDYLNYIRVGYNYDSKNKTMQNITSFIPLLASVASLGMGIATNNPFMIGMGAVGAGTSIVSAGFNVAERENAFSKNLAELQAKAFTAQGSQDIDLFNYYAGNKLKFKQYIPDNIDQINELFRLYGYVSNRIGSESNINSRTRFNFIQCNLDLERNNGKTSFKEDYVSDIKSKFASGVFYIHKYNGTWDLERKEINTEISLL